jgi:predicted TIM-barrel fold metal-dependent hydrolase
VYERRQASDPVEYAERLLRETAAELLLVDDGYPPADAAISPDELGALAGCPVRPVMRIEPRANGDLVHPVGTLAAIDGGARANGFVALKTIAAYRGGLDLDQLRPSARKILFAALEANEATRDPLPVQVHAGLGDPDPLLPSAAPGYFKPIFERFADTRFVLLHCYPFVREAGWLTSVYANVFLDLSLTIPHVSRPAAVLAEALELAPVSKLLYGSDAIGTPEL